MGQTATLSKQSNWTLCLSTGLAMFSMFFGAGNIVFPIALGEFARGHQFMGMLGLLITAIFVPFLGLFSILAFEGNYRIFFARIGKVPGFILMLLILGLIGPFGGIPRCITISYSTLHAFGINSLAGINLFSFSALCCIVIFIFTYQPNKVLPLLGKVLTPLLLICLGCIVVKGFWMQGSISPAQSLSSLEIFTRGFLDGYNTMDLLAAFFFSSIVLLCLKSGSLSSQKETLKIAGAASLIAAVLLGLIYVLFCTLAARHGNDLSGIPSERMLGALAFKCLGPQAGMIAGCAICFACLTTEIALTVVVAEFVHDTLLKKKFSYVLCLIFSLVVTFAISILKFQGISNFIVPILQFLYPALIVLSATNLLYYWTGFACTKRIFYSVVLATLLLKVLF